MADMHLKPWTNYLLLSILCLLLYLPGITSIPVDDRDSAHFAQATRQMLETGNYFQIRYQGVTRYQKPPGINWLQAFFVKTLSTPESPAIWPYRLPSVIGAWLSVLLTFALAKRFYGKKIAFIAAITLASTLLLNIEAHLAVIDTSLLLSVLLMQGALWVVYHHSQQKEPVHWKWGLLFFLSMAYGFLLKGVTPLIGFLTLITLSFLDKTTRYFKNLHWQWGLLLFLLLSAGWLMAVSLSEHTNYLLQMFNKDLLPKLAGNHESHGAPFGTHFILLFITFWPFSLFLYPTLLHAWKNRSCSHEKFLLAWIIPAWLFFEIMPTKLPQYLLPVFPALAILTAYVITHLEDKNYRGLHTLSLLWGVGSFLLVSAFMLIPWLLRIPIHVLSIFTWLTLGLSLTISGAMFYMFKRNYLKVCYLLVVGNLLCFSSGYQWFLPALKPIWSSQMVANFLAQKLPTRINAQNPLHVIGYGEPSLVFLLGTKSVQFDTLSTAIERTRLNTPSYILMDAAFQSDFLSQTQGKQVSATLLQTFQSFNYNKGHWITLLLYEIK